MLRYVDAHLQPVELVSVRSRLVAVPMAPPFYEETIGTTLDARRFSVTWSNASTARQMAVDAALEYVRSHAHVAHELQSCLNESTHSVANRSSGAVVLGSGTTSSS